MTRHSDRRLALDLLFLDTDKARDLAAFVARHALAPARRAHRLPAPRIDEGDVFLFRPAAPLPGGGRAGEMRWAVPEHPAAHFDPLIRGRLLFGPLFPRCGTPAMTTPEQTWVARSTVAGGPRETRTIAQ